MVVLFQSPGIWCAESFYPLCYNYYLFRCHFHFRSAITSHLPVDTPLLLCVLLVFCCFCSSSFVSSYHFAPQRYLNLCTIFALNVSPWGRSRRSPPNPPPGPVERKEWPIHRGGEEGGHSHTHAHTDTPLHHNTFSLTSFQRFRSEHGPYRLVEYLL